MKKQFIYPAEIATLCLDTYWNKHGGWDLGTPAQKWALNWARKHFQELKLLSWKEIYKRYRKSLVQE